MSTILENSIWPNPDGPLGFNKVAIPDGVNTLWPDGDALIGNVVYKNGLISGFVDTKVLVLNDSATTTIPYDYVDITLDSIEEGGLTINKGERCKYLNVKYFELPADFTELEYLESSGTQYIDTGIVPQTDTRLFLDCERLATLAGMNSIFGCRNTVSGKTDHYDAYFSYATPETVGFRPYKQLTFNFPSGRFTAAFTGSIVEITGNEPASYSPTGTVETSNSLYLLSINYGTGRISQLSVFKVYEFVLASPERTLLNLVPVLDADGTPCMYDKASKTCFYNNGTGTFGYRIKTTSESITPMSLRDPYYVAPSGVWAKIKSENELEIIADTDLQNGETQDYTWFANTAEAYNHFDIVPKETEMI